MQNLLKKMWLRKLSNHRILELEESHFTDSKIQKKLERKIDLSAAT